MPLAGATDVSTIDKVAVVLHSLFHLHIFHVFMKRIIASELAHMFSNKVA